MKNWWKAIDFSASFRVWRDLLAGATTRHPKRLRRGAHRRTAPFEGLEPRALLAGNVTALNFFNDATLFGDSADNAVEIRVDDGDLVVQGLNGTRVNGNTNPVVLFTDTDTIPDDLRAFLGRGDDTVRIAAGVGIGDDAHLNTGSGNDQVFLEGLGFAPINIGDDLSIFTSRGDDEVLLENAAVGGDVSLFSSHGDDRIAVVNGTVDDRLSVWAGRGDDELFLDPGFVGGRTRVFAGSGDDEIIAHGHNEPGVPEFAGSVRFDGGRGADVVQIDQAKQFASEPTLRSILRVDERVIEFAGASQEGLDVRNIAGPVPDPPGAGSTDFNLDGVSFSGGEVSFAGFGPAYASPPSAYLLGDTISGTPLSGPAVVEFDGLASFAKFFFVQFGGSPLVATAYDASGAVVDTVAAAAPSFLGDPGNFVVLSGESAIKRIEITGAGLGGIDNFAFAEVPIVEFSPAEGLTFRNIPAGDAPGTGSTTFSLQGANFSGGEVARVGLGPLYASPPTAYLVESGSITFDKAARSVRFFFVGNDPAATATFYDTYGNVIASVSANTPTTLGDPANFVQVSGTKIGRIEFSGGLAAVDNLSFLSY